MHACILNLTAFYIICSKKEQQLSILVEWWRWHAQFAMLLLITVMKMKKWCIILCLFINCALQCSKCTCLWDDSQANFVTLLNFSMHSTVSLDFKRENYSHFPYKTACNKIGQGKVYVGIIHFTRLCVVINLVIKVMELKIISFMRNFQALGCTFTYFPA